MIPFAIGAGFVALCLGGTAPSAHALDPLLHLAAGPGEFHLTAGHDEETFDFEKTEELRVCLGTSDQAVPLGVDYEGRHEVVKPGECHDFRAKSVTLEPEEPLESGWLLNGELETRKPAKS